MSSAAPPSATPDGSSALALQLARWFEERLHESAVGHSALVRVYGLDLIDVDGLDVRSPDAARVSFVGDARSPERLAELLAPRGAWPHDATAFVSTSWLAVAPRPVARPGEFEQRRRARVVRVAVGTGIAGVARFDGEASAVVLPTAT